MEWSEEPDLVFRRRRVMIRSGRADTSPRLPRCDDPVAMPTMAEEATRQRLDDEISWYDEKSARSQRLYKKFLYLARAGPYASDNPHPLLAERIEGLISQENAKWISAREEPAVPAEKTA